MKVVGLGWRVDGGFCGTCSKDSAASLEGIVGCLWRVFVVLLK